MKSLPPLGGTVDAQDAINVVNEVDRLLNHDDVTVTFSEPFIFPFAMLFLSRGICGLKRRGHVVNVRGATQSWYFDLMRFPTSIFTQSQEIDACLQLPDPQRTRKSYLPISTIKRQEVESNVDLSFEDHPINVEAARLSRFLMRKERGRDVALVAYCLKELIRNFVEHSGAGRLWVCGQYYPGTEGHPVELALVDAGKGLRRSLHENPDLRTEITDDESAIEYALLPGVSSKLPTADTESNNSGFGLYFMKRIAELAGRLIVGSGSRARILTASRTPEHIDAIFSGTAVGMKISIDCFREIDLDDKLAQWQEEAGIVASRPSLVSLPWLR